MTSRSKNISRAFVFESEGLDWDRHLYSRIKSRRDSLQSLIDNKRSALNSAPQGNLRIIKRANNRYQYFHRTTPDDPNGTYIKNDNIDIAIALAQKQYDREIMKQAKKELRQIEKYLAVLEKTQIEDIYENMSRPRQELITPVVLPDDRYIAEWLKEEYHSMPFDNAGSFYSAKGIRVRSKAEVMIADMLEHYDIPYRYEYPITLNGLGIVRPDFFCLNISSRKEIIWEHFGMMDNIAYANKNIRKITAYEQNGYYAGNNMIMTFESSQLALDSNLIKKKIENYLM